MKASSYASNFLKATDVKEPMTVTISSVEEETFRGEKGDDTKLAVFFKETAQGVALSRTSINQLIEIFGTDETDDWNGKRVILFNDRSVTYKGRAVGGLRFRAVS